MNQRSRNIVLLLVVVLVLIGGGYWYFKSSHEGLPLQADAPASVEEEQQIIETNWLSFSVPEELKETELTVQMEVLQPVEKIEILWEHPANVQYEAYELTAFEPGDTQARYEINAAYGNLLPGLNRYTVKTFALGSSEEKEASIAVFELALDISLLADISPSLIDLSDIPQQTSSEEVEFTGKLTTEGVYSIRVYSYHPESGKATYAQLSQFSPGDSEFLYKGSADLGNILYGRNQFIFEALDQEGVVISRSHFDLESSFETLTEQVERLFGEFTKVPGGWYVSSELPWFALRPAYETVYFQPDERSVVMPRPTLMYSAESDRQTPLCEFLGSIDYQQENYSYQGYEYETCQRYRTGMAVYDRFLSHLTYSPVEVVLRTDYQDIRDTASSALVMIETGGMPEVRSELVDFNSSDDDFQQAETAPESEEEAQEEERFYVFQLLIQDQIPYQENYSGDIPDALNEEQSLVFEEVRELLNRHSGEELFTEMLFTGVDAVDPVNQQ